MKRRGFTLIELMVVIAIIIILAAIAISNYLKMTERAKKSRVAGDFAAIATALETYRTDWNEYPVTGGAVQIAGTDLDLTGGAASELAGADIATNTNYGKTATGETAPVQYIASNTLTSMVNPYSSAKYDQYQYKGSTDHWLLYATIPGVPTYLSRTDETAALSGPSSGILPFPSTP